MKRFAACALFVALALPAYAQNTTFDQLLSGKDVALNLKLKDLNGDWRRVSIGGVDKGKNAIGDMLGPLMQMGMMSDKNKGKDDAASAMLGMSVLSSMFGGGGSKDPVYYTKGQTVTMGGETFVVAYVYRKPTLDFMKLIADSEKNGGKEPDFTKMAGEGKMTADSSLTLTLINTKTISTLSDIRPFDMNAEIAEAENGGGGLMDLMNLGMKSTPMGNDNFHAAPVLDESGLKVTPAVKKAILSDAKLTGADNSINIDADAATNVLTIRGHVRSEAQKQRASAVVKKVLADKGSAMTIHNNLVVRAGGRK